MVRRKLLSRAEKSGTRRTKKWGAVKRKLKISMIFVEIPSIFVQIPLIFVEISLIF